MKCTHPMKIEEVINGANYTHMVSCGGCMPCRINRRQQWAGRILLESINYVHNSFLTLTYDDEHIPEQLVKRDLTLFLKRFRNTYGAFRYYACGEYGEKTKRPHYHIVLFGVPAIKSVESICQKKWDMGFIDIRPLNRERAVYVAKYITKKLSPKEAKKRGENKVQPFSQMSRRPGIGLRSVPHFAKSLEKYGVVAKHSEDLYQLSTKGMFRLYGKLWPIDKYLMQCISEYLGEKKIEKIAGLKAMINRMNYIKEVKTGKLLKERVNVDNHLKFADSVKKGKL